MKTEKELKKEEEDLISKKDELSKEEYKKRSDGLRKKVAKYQADRRQALDKIGKQRTEAKQTLLSKLDPILKDYIAEINISIVITPNANIDPCVRNALVPPAFPLPKFRISTPFTFPSRTLPEVEPIR